MKMNDRYLFKAKRIDNGGWIFGNYLTNGIENHFINAFQEKDGKFTFDMYEIDEFTVCQCTGLKDRNGTLIFENDIILTLKEDGYSLVSWSDTEAMWETYNKVEGVMLDFNNYWSDEIEVFGNRFDNPELLERD